MSVQMEAHHRYKHGQKPRHTPRPKTSVKICVWVGISWQGATGTCMFDSIMDAPMYTCILDQYLLPFLHDVCPTGHRSMQDNNPKHTSRHAQAFFR